MIILNDEELVVRELVEVSNDSSGSSGGSSLELFPLNA